MGYGYRIQSKRTTNSYRDGWDRIFGNKEEETQEPELDVIGPTDPLREIVEMASQPREWWQQKYDEAIAFGDTEEAEAIAAILKVME